MNQTLLPDFGLSTTALHPDDALESRFAHLQRRRRVRLSDAVTVIFEDAQTLWFRMEELARLARYAPSAQQQRQLEWYKRLMPGDGRLSAAIWFNPRRFVPNPEQSPFEGAAVCIHSVAHVIHGTIFPEQMRDRHLGHVCWASFQFNAAQREVLHDPYTNWHFTLELQHFMPLTTRLPESVVESLSSDVE